MNYDERYFTWESIYHRAEWKLRQLNNQKKEKTKNVFIRRSICIAHGKILNDNHRFVQWNLTFFLSTLIRLLFGDFIACLNKERYLCFPPRSELSIARCLFVKICFHHSNSAWTLRRRISRETIHVMRRLTIFVDYLSWENLSCRVINCFRLVYDACKWWLYKDLGSEFSHRFRFNL